jgi:hypothetical protein
MAEGKAWHKGLEMFFTRPENYIGDALQELTDTKDEIQDFDEEEFQIVGERLEENLIVYREEFADRNWKDNQYVEMKVSKIPSPIEGGLPLTAQMDLVDNKGNPVDHKYVGVYSIGNGYEHYVQAWFYYWATQNLTGKFPEYFVLSEFKKTKNRDKNPQLQDTVILYDQKWIDKVSEWYRQVSLMVQNQTYYPINPFKNFDNEDWQAYLAD